LRQAAQRAIYHIQRELESVADTGNAAVVLCDRGTVDCAAYWIGDRDLFSAVGTTRAIELARYDAVIHRGMVRPPAPIDRGANGGFPPKGRKSLSASER